jgi:predicted dehydrogenase
MSKTTSRRSFLQTGAVAGIGFWVAGGVQAQESKSPNEKVRMASVGCGGKGESDSSDAGSKGEMVAICDVDEKILNGAASRFPKAKKFFDFRKMLEEMCDKIDAVTVSTPDHCHAAASAMAMRMGKHCFCQKPLTHTIFEARALGNLAREKKLATQMGNQGTAEAGLRKAATLLKTGFLGKVSEVHVWTNRPIWAQGGNRPGEAPVPANLKWDLWLGPAPVRPYANGYHPFSWRGWWDFGTGALGDMACHTVNMPFMGLNLRDPLSVQAKTSGHNKDSYPKWSIIEFEFPATDARPALKFFWYDGGKLPAKELLNGKNPSGSGCVIVGEKGKIYSPNDYASEFEVFGDLKVPEEVKFEESPGHFEEWVRAIKGGPAAMSNFPDYAGPLTETILLGNLAVWAADKGEGKKIEWDAKNLKTTNAPEVEHIIKAEYRSGYTL